jgi:signal transduction histidine kinase
MRLIISLVTILMAAGVLWSQGSPAASPALLVACAAACVAEALGVRLPHYGTVSFGLVVYLPVIAQGTPGGSSALAVALVALTLRELLAYTTAERMADEVLLELLPLSMACLAPTLFRPGDPEAMLWLASGLTYISVRHMAISGLKVHLPAFEAEMVKRLQAATASLRWGILGLSLLSIPLVRQFPVLVLAVLPTLYSLRKSAIHAYAYLDKEDKKVLRKSLKGAETQVVELTRSLQTTEAERNLLFDLSSETARCASLTELLIVLEKKARGLKLGRRLELLLQESSSGWLFLSFEEATHRPLCRPIDPRTLDPAFRDCWTSVTSQASGSRALHPLPGLGVLSLEPAPSKDPAAQLPVTSLFCSQAALACLSALRFEALEHTLADLARSNSELERAAGDLVKANSSLQVEKESLRVAMEKLQASEAKLIEGAKLAAIGQLSAGLAHEINNPLGSIRLGIELTLRKEQLSPFSRDLLEKGLKGVQRAESVIGSLLTYSRAGSKGKVPVACWDVLFDTCSFLNASLRIQNITVKVPERGPEATVLANPQELQQILTNLLLNAKDAVEGAKEAVVQLAAGSDGKEFHWEVHDSGPGIPPEIMDKIFDPFFTTKPVGKGTGLGLSVSREMATAQGGRLEAGPSRLLGGACFRLSLPLGPGPK